MFQASFHTVVTLRFFDYAPPDTVVSNLKLVAVERLLSIEDAEEIRISCTSSQANGFPYEGKLSPEATDEVDSAA